MKKTMGQRGRLTLREASRQRGRAATKSAPQSGGLRDALRLSLRRVASRGLRQPARQALLLLRPALTSPMLRREPLKITVEAIKRPPATSVLRLTPTLTLKRGGPLAKLTRLI